MDLTTIDQLPDELVENILTNLHGADLLSCRKVCSRWHIFVDSINERFRRKCCREYPDIYERSQRTSGLSWRDLYRSFELWEHVSEATVQVTPCPYGDIGRHNLRGFIRPFNLLRNGIISFPVKSDPCQYKFEYDAVVYFDINKREEIDRKLWDVSFTEYMENDDLIVFEVIKERKHILRVVSKLKENEWTEQITTVYLHFSSWVLKGNEVFYMSEERDVIKLCRLRVIWNDAELRYENSVLTDSDTYDVFDVGYIDGKLHVYKMHERWLYIAAVEDKEMKTVLCINMDDEDALDTSSIAEVKKYGFSWCNPFVFGKMTDGKAQRRFPYGPHLIILTSNSHETGKIDIYTNSNKAASEVKATSQPALSVTIEDDEMMLPRRNCSKFDMIDVVETDSGHVILVMYCNRLITIDVNHDECRSDSKTVVTRVEGNI